MIKIEYDDVLLILMRWREKVYDHDSSYNNDMFAIDAIKEYFESKIEK